MVVAGVEVGVGVVVVFAVEVVVGVVVAVEVVVGVGVVGGVVSGVVRREKLAMILCVDPGLRGCGVAFFHDGRLYSAKYVKNPVENRRGYTAHAEMASAVASDLYGGETEVIIEHPRIYPGSAQQKGDLNDLLDVVAVGAAIAALSNRVTITVFPQEWKGQVPKATMTERILRSLSEEERGKISPCRKDLMHNVVDAVGIGLWHFGRLNKKVIPHAE